MQGPRVVEVDSIQHELLEPYLEIRSRNWTRHSGRFIAEGPLLVDRLISSDYPIHSVLLDRKYFNHYIDRFPGPISVIVVDHSMIEQIVGFNFHRGVLACGQRKELSLVQNLSCLSEPEETWIGLIGIQDPENVGGILRSAAGLGVRKVLIGPGTADPLSRRALRVSMGNTLALELFESRHVLPDLEILAGLGMESIATSLDPDAIALESSRRSSPIILLFGNEKQGLPSDILNHANRRVKIEMHHGTDSLNVSVAAAISLYHFLRVCQRG